MNINFELTGKIEGYFFLFMRGKMSQAMVFANEDLKRHIFSFGSPDHRRHMRNLCKELTYTDVSRYWKELLIPIPYQWFKDSIKDDSCETILDEVKWFYRLNRCMCCSRHSHHKPAILYDPPYGLLLLEGEERRVPEDKNLHDCNCHCRRMMRFALRHFHATRNL